jgi:nitrite reductase/ring-hydroxylating ferredoxin subunit
VATKQRLICDSTDLIDGGKGIRFEWVRGLQTDPAFVVRHGGRAYAYVNRCGHIPVELDWQPAEFFDYSGLYLICATHGALYSPQSGRCLAGKCAGKGLHALPVIEQDGKIYLIEEGDYGE